MKHEGKLQENKNNNLVKRFHQFVKVVKGPVNSAIYDLLEGEVYHVTNDDIQAFNAGEYSRIETFMNGAEKANLIINVMPHHWIPQIKLDNSLDEDSLEDIEIELHIEAGNPLEEIISAFQAYSIQKIYFYGSKLPELKKHPKIDIELAKKDFESCIQKCSADGVFSKIFRAAYQFNYKFNSCWGTVIAITSDGMIRPCIQSEIEIGNIETDLDDVGKLIEEMLLYWTFTKDNVQRCKACEFRYGCFDCREIAIRKTGHMHGENCLCNYNPFTGNWES